jgi:hypothetical protein
MKLHRFNDDGRYTSTVLTTEEGASYEDQTRIFIGDADPRTQYHDIANDCPVDKPPQPSTAHIFDYTTKTWIDPRTLQDFKDAQWALIKSARNTAEYAGFVWGGSAFDSDALSQGRITGAVTMAQMTPTFTIDWTLADNTVRTLTAIQMIGVGVALGAHVEAQFSHGQALRVQIEAAATSAEVLLIVW